MSTYRTEQQKKRKQAQKKKATKTASKKQKSPKKVKPATKATRQSAPVVTQAVSVTPPMPSTQNTSVIPDVVASAPSTTISQLAQSVGRASANANAPTSLYPSYLSELSAEGVTRQLLQHAQMKPVALGQLKAHVHTVRASGLKQKAMWQMIGGGTLLALGILPQVILFRFGISFESLYQIMLNVLTYQMDGSGITPAILIALVQVMLIGGGATLTTLGVLNQAKFDSWKLSEEIANRV